MRWNSAQGSIVDGSTSYTITGLASGTTYSVRVTATNAAGSNESDTMSVQTGEHANISACYIAEYRDLHFLYNQCSSTDRAVITT